MAVEPLSLVLSGLGGYGEVYLEAVLSGLDSAPPVRLAGAADPAHERCTRPADLNARKIPLFPTLDAFYAAGGRAELAVIAAPPHFHCSQTCLALRHGSHVLCEKPAAVTPSEVDRMIEARDQAGRFVAVGFQWSFEPSVLALKGEILSGRLGRPLRMKALCLWPRTEVYYRRNDWAGRIRDPEGRLVRDGPVMNAMAHFLHHLLFLSGDAVDRSAEPTEVTAERYRANPVENHDTVALRARTRNGAELLFFASHAVREERGPCFHLEFERGAVTWPGGAAPVSVHLREGPSRSYPSPARGDEMEKLRTCLLAASGRGPIPCGLEAARPHLQVVEAIHASMETTVPFPSGLVREERREADRLLWVDGLTDTLLACYDQWILPSEQGLPWTRPGRPVPV